MSPELALLVAIAIPLLGALGVALTGRWPNVREAVTLTAALGTVVVVAQLWSLHFDAPDLVIETTLLEVMPGAALVFKLEPLGMVFALVASGLWGLTSVYAVGYLRGHRETHQTRFFICFALAISAALGIAFSKNLFTLFLFYELLTFSTYPLVTHAGTEEARRAGRTYLGILVSTSVAFLLFAIIWTGALAGSLDFIAGGLLPVHTAPSVVAVLLGLYAFGIGKAALMPFHRWLPAAMVAPTPVSALLHAVAVVKAGVFTVLKVVVYVFGLDLLTTTGASTWLMYVASFTILSASIVALREDNLKRRLAYSTISQLGYIVLAAALATKAAIVGGGLHIAMHAAGKITLFFCAGALYVAAHKTKVSELDGIGKRMPFTMVAFSLASLSVIGLPPFGGMWSKWWMALGAADAHQNVFIGVYMLSSLLSVGYLLPIVARAFFRPLPPDTPGHFAEAPALCVVPLCVTAALSAALFYLADPLVLMLEHIAVVKSAVGG